MNAVARVWHLHGKSTMLPVLRVCSYRTRPLRPMPWRWVPREHHGLCIGLAANLHDNWPRSERLTHEDTVMTIDTTREAAAQPRGFAAVQQPARRRFTHAAAWGLLGLAAVVAVGEWAGWPFLASPLQHWLAERLDRSVQLAKTDEGGRGARFRFVGGVRIDVPLLRIDAPAWQDPSASPTLDATDLHLRLRYGDLWRAWHSGAIRIAALTATTLDAVLERRADGQATWKLGTTPTPDPAAQDATPMQIPTVDALRVEKGTVHWIDPSNGTDVKARLALTPQGAQGSAAPPGPLAALQLTLTAKGQLQKLPLALALRADGALPMANSDPGASTLLHLDGQWGSSELKFDGKALDLLHAGQVSGEFLVKGPSLAAVGDLFRVTLPTTAKFSAAGQIVKREQQWYVVFDDATVGSSKLKGAFSYDAAASIPVLSGRLTGERLFLSDLAPAVGAGAETSKKRANGKVLPDRQFDLPSLRVMQANVLIDVQEVDLNTKLLEPVRPLRAHLLLTDGVLRLDQIDARTAKGRLRGNMQLDGRQKQALWKTDLRWSGVELAEWIHQDRPSGAPPYISGKLDGSVQWTGKGTSTAQILGSLNGPMRVFLRQGQVSHLAIEVAGIDVFQALGLVIGGDKRLKISCGAAEMVATNGAIRPTVFVVDTVDSVVFLDGMVSLENEAMDLRMVVTPKDFSPLTLRSPLRVQGTFSHPQVSIEPSKVGAKLLGSALLGLINPLAALIPLIDPGDAAATTEASAECKTLAGRIANRPSTLQGAGKSNR